MIITLVRQISKLSNLFTYNANTENTLLFLRKARLFVKSRYSRNRQWSKSIVYFGLWFNIISVIWSIYYCYRYIFIFSHLYWLGAAFVLIAAIRISRFINLSALLAFYKNFTFKV